MKGSKQPPLNVIISVVSSAVNVPKALKVLVVACAVAVVTDVTL